MDNRLIRKIWIFGVIAILGLLIRISTEPINSEGLLRLMVLDIGQGDAILLDTPKGKHILIDGGNSEDILRLLKIFLSLPKEFDLVIATHNHSDHIGGLISVLDHYKVANIWISGANYAKSNTFKRWQQILQQEKDEGSTIEKVKTDKEYELDQLKIKVLYPLEDFDGIDPAEQHDANIVTKIDYGTSSFLLTGDLDTDNERELVDYYQHKLAAKVLKVSHHGSSNSTSEQLLAFVDPAIALISVGQNNRYGHPHRATLKRLENVGAEIFRTDRDGTIIVKSNGEKIWVTTTNK